MGKTREILTRRKSVQNIRKITRTMELVATAQYRAVQGAAERVRPYAEQITRMVHDLVTALPGELDSPLLTEHPKVTRTALIVMASNRGLCGDYNSSVLHLAREQRDQWVKAGRSVDVYAVGKAAAVFFRAGKVPLRWSRRQFEGQIDIEAVSELADDMIDRYTRGELRSVAVVYTHFVSIGVQKPTVMRLLPLGEAVAAPVGPRDWTGLPMGAIEYDFIPSPEAILSELLPRTVALRLYRAFVDAITGEHIARMAAMRVASENADDMIRELTMRYNRARQAAITTGLAEIAAGVEAMRG